MTIYQITVHAVPYYAISIPVWDERVADIRNFKGRRWDAERKVWLIPHTSESKLFLEFLTTHRLVQQAYIRKPPKQPEPKQAAPSTELPPLSEERLLKINQFRDYLQAKRFSLSTIKTYSDALRIFLRYFADKPLEQIDNQDVIHFNVHYILANNYSTTYQNQVVNAIKKFFYKIENRSLDLEAIERPRKEFRLPEVLSKNEIKSILSTPKNIKHRTMLCLIYACGLRRSELLNMLPTDIDSKRYLIIIRQGKGNKDRIVPLSEAILAMLREYYRLYRPKKYLFEGQYAGEQYSAASLQKVLKLAVQSAKINKPVTLHWLRHSYATQLLESGTDLRYIQELLGHKSSLTTEIYTHVSTKSLQNIKSPFDDL